MHVITMDCLFLLIWTLPIPLVGCTSIKLLSTLLSWNIIKARGISSNMHTLLNPTHAPAWFGTKTNNHLSLFSVICVNDTALLWALVCGEKSRQVIVKTQVQLVFQQRSTIYHLLAPASCVQPVATCVFMILFAFVPRRRCTFTARTPPSTFRPAILPATATD